MPSSVPVALLITAAGRSTRFTDSGGSIPVKKEFYPLDGESVLASALRAFLSPLTTPPYRLSTVVITCTPGLVSETMQQITDLPDRVRPLLRFTEGGATRRISVYSGLQLLAREENRPDYVLIHDGSRPWIKEQVILKTLSAARKYGGAAPAVPLVDALKDISEDGLIQAHYDRSRFVGIQTPQTFRFPDILHAHACADADNAVVHDDTELFMQWGGTVMTVPGDITNRKITFLTDVTAAAEKRASGRELNE